MASKTHPCFKGPSDECCCKFVPQPRGILVSNDFVRQIVPKSSVHENVLQREPKFTERRQRYEESVQIPNKADPKDPTNSEGPDSVLDISDIRLLRIKSFREDNMRECMSTVNQYLYKRYQKIFSSGHDTHKCRHRFRINNRNRLEPIDANESGQSTCMECGRATDYFERFKSGYPWNKGDLFYEGSHVPIIHIEQPAENKDAPKSMLKANKRIPPKSSRSVPIHPRICSTEIALSLALVNQRLEN